MTLMETAQLLGNFGEFLGAIAVVATLAYLAVQVRHGKDSLDANTRSLRAQIAQARADNQQSFYRDAMHSDHWPSIIAKRRESIDSEHYAASLTPEERERVRLFLWGEMNDVRNQYRQFEEGFLDEAIWKWSTRGQIVRLLSLLPTFVPNLMAQDPTVKALYNQIAAEEGLPPIDDSAGWQAQFRREG